MARGEKEMEGKPLLCPEEAEMREYQRSHGVNEDRDEMEKNSLWCSSCSD